MRLSEGLRKLMGGRKYVKVKELSRATLLEYAKSKGDVIEVTLFTVKVTALDSSSLEVIMEEGDRQVSTLKREIQQQHGAAVFSQQLFLMAQSVQEASESPLSDTALLLERVRYQCASMLIQVFDFSPAIAVPVLTSFSASCLCRLAMGC